VLLIMLLLAMTLGLSYSLVRSQNTASHIERNADRRGMAQQAAMTGLTMAIKKMQTSAWAGVGTTYIGQLSSSQSFSVTYTVGDPSLTSGSANYSDYPYRVTLLSTGTALDPIDATCVSIHKTQAVVRLVPRALAAEPTEWANTLGLTAYEYKSGTFSVAVPFLLKGPLRTAGALTLAHDYSWSAAARQQYLTDLNTMRGKGYADCRPLTGTVNCPTASQESGLISLLNTSMGVATNNTAAITSSALNFTQSVDSYRIYPGGPSYNVNASWVGTIQSFQPSPLTNPLGICVCQGTTSVNSKTSFQGTLFTRGSGVLGSGAIYVNGQGIQFTPVNLPPLYGTTPPVRLPLAVAADSFRIYPGSTVTMQGLVVATNQFEVQSDKQSNMQLAYQGEIVAQDILLDMRSDWNQSKSWWNKQWKDFGKQSAQPFFPAYLQTSDSLNYTPALSIGPDAASTRYTWNNLQNPIYAPGPNDSGGLRWDLVSWTDYP